MNELFFPIVLVAGIGLVLGLGLAIASALMSVPVDEKKLKIRECLPGANCGACGYSGCDAYAEVIANGNCNKTNLCTPGGNDVATEIASVLGVEVNTVEKQLAVVKCAGNYDNAPKKTEYRGIKSCAAANMMYAGDKLCQYGCLGYGDCAVACPFNAINIIDGRAIINTLLCTGCGLCIQSCPKLIIELIPADYKAVVLCSSKSKGAVARKTCSVACIGCMKCKKVCEYKAIEVENFLAKIDNNKCIGCGKCAEECPEHCIIIA